MVVLVGHDDAVLAVAADARRPVELPAALARVAKVEAESPIFVVNLRLMTKLQVFPSLCGLGWVDFGFGMFQHMPNRPPFS